MNIFQRQYEELRCTPTGHVYKIEGDQGEQLEIRCKNRERAKLIAKCYGINATTVEQV